MSECKHNMWERSGHPLDCVQCLKAELAQRYEDYKIQVHAIADRDTELQKVRAENEALKAGWTPFDPEDESTWPEEEGTYLCQLPDAQHVLLFKDGGFKPFVVEAWMPIPEYEP